MGIQKKLLFTSLALLALFFITMFLTFSSDEEENRRKKDQNSKALAYLLQGNSGEKNRANPLGVRDENADSIFDSDYFKSGAMRYEEEVAAQAGQEGEIPINPATGKPYPAEAMESFDELRELFPENDLIPRRMTQEMRAKQEQFNNKLSAATNNVFGGSATPDDVKFYYSHVKKQGNDRLEIINYLIESQGGDDPEMDKKFQEILSNIKFQNEQVDKEMAQAYQKAGIPTP
ncbi:hypothetical protein LPTSP4_11030 [Leptospira ryugenii]|uniref:Lipoprotein n=1 Tax=Leptospira ryugenii TaxID=1917863 RepID=A0A2P2DY83_9LEPT|nr:hypothetical protein [Leptospira ryugenii]GBF49587.1 hypothetical protein LPTSP4_11030 [Leptospira ryugenii]